MSDREVKVHNTLQLHVLSIFFYKIVKINTIYIQSKEMLCD